MYVQKYFTRPVCGVYRAQYNVEIRRKPIGTTGMVIIYTLEPKTYGSSKLQTLVRRGCFRTNRFLLFLP